MAGLVTYRQERIRPPAWRRWLMPVGCAIVCLGLLPAAGFAQDTQTQDIQAKVTDVASLTLVPLPNEAIAVIKGSGLQGPGIGSQPPAGGTITLWDELKPPVQLQTTGSGTSIITINNPAK
jgi:hypothetical protein